MTKTKIWMHSLEHSENGLKAVKLNKTSLGVFLYHALKCGSEIGDVWPFNSNYDSSWVGITIKIDPDKIPEFEKNSGYGLKQPPIIKLN
jgi:hypothetical protein